jgi:1-deoxy-D-xylulose-5-phosphate reductoisomerase
LNDARIMKKISLLGSTGSIGSNTLRVISEFSDEMEVFALAAGRNLPALAEQVIKYRPSLVSVSEPEDIPRLKSLLNGRARWQDNIEYVSGAEGLKLAATHPESDTVVCAISGSAGLLPALESVRHKKQLALATKEALVMAGEILIRESRLQERAILPIDSEHNAIHQCLRGENPDSVRRLILTASGGPFRTTPLDQFDSITPDCALRHPTWQMGRKISIDSATLMNKGLEVIEAHWLFDIQATAIEVLIHPQSTVHSMVEMIDGSVIAQLGIADMRVAIQYVLTYPSRRRNNLPSLDLTALGRLEFEAPDRRRFPTIRLAYEALHAGGTMPAVLNAANEIAVQAFLDGRIRFAEIPEVIEKTMQQHDRKQLDSIETVLEAHRSALCAAERFVANPRSLRV